LHNIEEDRSTVMIKKEFYAKDDLEVKILFEPYRRRILRVYLDSKESLTVKQVATILGEKPSKVHYHVMKLLSIGALELDRTETIKSIIAKYYKTRYVGFHMDTSNLTNDTLPILKSECEKAFDRISNDFSTDLKNYYDAVESKGTDYQRMLVLRNFKLYMTKEEQLEVIQHFSEIIEKYSNVDESKEVYSALMCLTRVK
jgi:DNA-binding transcriptional ArsR family regulator